MKADFDSGLIAPLVDIGAPGLTTLTPLFGGTVNVVVDASSPLAGTVLAETSNLFQDSIHSVDLLDWAPGLGQTITLLSFLGGDAYGLTLDLDAGQLRLIRIQSQSGTTVASAPVTLDPEQTDYRLFLWRNGSVLTGQLKDLKDISNPVAEISFDDVVGLPGFSGYPGVSMVSADPMVSLGIDMTIDNFVAAPLVSDIDSDFVNDIDDSCEIFPNGPFELSNQVDSNQNGFGNACDPDFDEDGSVTFADLTPLVPAMGTLADGPALRFDVDGDRAITLADFALLYLFVEVFEQNTPGP